MKARIRQEISHRIAGSPKECLLRLREYAEAGVTHLILIFLDPKDVDLFVKEVLPELRAWK
jgi:alkanesulfonate monooxygenase SsuD/methylene tetrahydromethanopterin reductase-like flavin-dependent oxidoreductase (luciferase family)